MDRDIISVSVDASLKKVCEVITNLEKIKIWEPSHGLPIIRLEWFPSEGILKTGTILKVKARLWTFVAECIELTENKVKWKFIEGPLKGTECWIAQPAEGGCKVVKLLEYEVDGFNRLLWQLIGRRIHHWASLIQLENVKILAEERPKEVQDVHTNIYSRSS